MPTPSAQGFSTPSLLTSAFRRSAHPTCPPEEDRSSAERIRISATTGLTINPLLLSEGMLNRDIPGSVGAMDEATPLAGEDGQQSQQHDKETEREQPPRDTPSPMSVDDLKSEEQDSVRSSPPPIASSPTPATSGSGILAPEPAHEGPRKYVSSFLRAGSKFEGTQQSDRQVYNVQVEIKHVDMAESFLCGYLRIEGLTADHPTLTTYFEGEIIGTKYTFQTRHPEWGSCEKVDFQHWDRFPAWRPLARAARKPDFTFKNYAERENVFMRWKEFFLVPDHKVRTISGASFEGFYYICFNQVSGTISGIYFHSKSERFQQLELKHVDDRGCSGAMEFR